MLIPSVCIAQVKIKPAIISTKVLDKTEQVQVKEYLEGKISKEITPAKNDYVDFYDKGTALFNSKKGVNFLGREVFETSNYSHYKVIVPDGTHLEGINFSQKEPHTVVFTNAMGGVSKNLIFTACNLTNVEPDESWIYADGSGPTQVKETLKESTDLGDGTYHVITSWQTEKDGKFVEVQTNEKILETNSYNDLLLDLNAE